MSVKTKAIVRVLPPQIVSYPQMKSALCKKLGAFEVDPVLEPLMIAPTSTEEKMGSILQLVSFGAPLAPSYIPPPYNRIGWKSAALWELVSLILEEGQSIFENAHRIYVTDTSTLVRGVRSFPVLIGDVGAIKLTRCSKPASNFPNTKILISKMAN